MSKPTPRPWFNGNNNGAFSIFAGDESNLYLVAYTANNIATRNPKSRANAAHIVKCVNMHEPLLKALDRAVEIMQFAYMNAPEQPKEIAEALALLAKAEAE